MRCSVAVMALLCLEILSAAAAKFSLESHIASESQSLVTGAPFFVLYTLTNVGDSPVAVLTQDTPLEDRIRSPFVTIEGKVESEYKGVVVKRRSHTEFADFTTLHPGQSISVQINLSQHYNFYSNGNCDITAVSSFKVVDAHMESAPSLESLPEGVRVASNSLTIKVQGAVAKKIPSVNGGGVTAQAVNYAACDGTQQASVVRSIANAQTMMGVATTVMEGSPSTPYAKYFENTGSVTSSRYDFIRLSMDNIENEFVTESYQIDCSCTDSFFAYVYPSDASHTIYLCAAFWTASEAVYQFDSKPGTLIHELSHFNNVAGTDDHAYGQAAVQNLARTDPDRAIKNADSQEYFVESNPGDGGILVPPAPTPPTPAPAPNPTEDQFLGTLALGAGAEGAVYLQGSTVGRGDTYGYPAPDVRIHFSLPSGLEDATLDVNSCSSVTDFDTHLYLLEASGTRVEDNDDASPSCSGSQTQSRMTVPSSALIAGGAYVVVVDGYGYSTGNFGVTVSLSTGGDPNDGGNGDDPETGNFFSEGGIAVVAGVSVGVVLLGAGILFVVLSVRRRRQMQFSTSRQHAANYSLPTTPPRPAQGNPDLVNMNPIHLDNVV